MKKTLLITSVFLMASTFSAQSHAENAYGFSWWNLTCESALEIREEMSVQSNAAVAALETKAKSQDWSNAKLNRRIAKTEARYDTVIEKLNEKALDLCDVEVTRD